MNRDHGGVPPLIRRERGRWLLCAAELIKVLGSTIEQLPVMSSVSENLPSETRARGLTWMNSLAEIVTAHYMRRTQN